MEFFEFKELAETFFINDVEKKFLWAYFLIAALCFAAVYVFQAVALYTIGKREGYKHTWMAFVPFFNTYYIGVVSEKNKIFNMKAKTVSLVAAIIEAAYAFFTILYYVAEFLIFDGGYAAPVYEICTFGGIEVNLLTGYNLDTLPQRLAWAGTVYRFFPNAVISWLSLVQLVFRIFLLIAFFQTYSCNRYVLFALLSILFPFKGIFMFAVKGNRAKNYREYLKERQQMQYQAYQAYMRNNGQGGSYNYNPYQGTGSPNPDRGAESRDPYQSSYYGSAPQDPFDGLGGNASEDGDGASKKDGDGENRGNGGDPFGDF